MWNDKAARTRANVGKRLDAAEEALESAAVLLTDMPADKNVRTSVGNALAWVGDARLRMEKNKGKRGK